MSDANPSVNETLKAQGDALLKQGETLTELKGELTALTKEFQKTLEQNGATFKSFTEMMTKLGTSDPDKITGDPVANAKAKKQRDKIQEMEDKIHTLEMREKAHSKLGTVEGLAKTYYFGDNPRTKQSVLRFAESILEDPFKKEYREKFFKGSVSKDSSLLHDFIQKIRNDGNVSPEDSFIKKSLNTIVGVDGAYFVPPEVDLMVQKWLFETSPLRQVAEVRMTAAQRYQFFIRGKLPPAFWVDSETETQQETDTNKFTKGEIVVNELAAQPIISLVSIEDSVIDIENELRNDLSEAFGLEENKAWVGNGNGIKVPKGLQYYAEKSSSWRL